jgi:hypothetical protein
MKSMQENFPLTPSWMRPEHMKDLPPSMRESKQDEKTIQFPAELENCGCIVSNVAMKLDTHQGNIKLCGFAIPIWHKNYFKMAPTHLFTG